MVRKNEIIEMFERNRDWNIDQSGLKKTHYEPYVFEDVKKKCDIEWFK